MSRLHSRCIYAGLPAILHSSLQLHQLCRWHPHPCRQCQQQYQQQQQQPEPGQHQHRQQQQRQRQLEQQQCQHCECDATRKEKKEEVIYGSDSWKMHDDRNKKESFKARTRKV